MRSLLMINKEKEKGGKKSLEMEGHQVSVLGNEQSIVMWDFSSTVMISHV